MIARLRLAALTVVLMAFGALSNAATATEPIPAGIPDGAVLATVAGTTDGDTFDIERADGETETVRLIGIDAPETQSPSDPVGCFGPEASERLKKLLPEGREIWLEADETDRDRFDRLLRYVWVVKGNGDVYLLNEVLVRDGYAIAKRYGPDTNHAERLERAQERAEKKPAGMWGECDMEPLDLAPAPSGDAEGCDPSYPTLCIAIGAGDLDCGDIVQRTFRVVAPDTHRFDSEGDGIGCEGP